MDIGRIGIWTAQFDRQPWREVAAAAAVLDDLGFGDDDFAQGDSDRLVDGLVGWGSLGDDFRRVHEHLDTSPNHVCLQVLPANRTAFPRRE